MNTTHAKRQSSGAVRSGGVFGDSDYGAGDGTKRRCGRTPFCLDLMAWLLMDQNGTLDTYYAVMRRQQPCPKLECSKCRRSPNSINGRNSVAGQPATDATGK